MKIKIICAMGCVLAALARGASGAAPASPPAAAAEIRLADAQIQATYDRIAEYHARHLAAQGVKLPKLRKADGGYTQAALTLVLLAQGYPETKTVSKSELTRFVREFYPHVNDVQQARHLAAQHGWYILSGSRNDDRTLDVPAGEYKLASLEKAYPGFNPRRRAETAGSDYWGALKKAYGYRCACCGSREGRPHLRWPETVTRLQKGHMDPRKPLEPGNVIPQCESCNQADRDFWIYDDKGRVVGVANPAIVDRSPEEVQRAIYERLRLKYGETPPPGISAAD